MEAGAGAAERGQGRRRGDAARAQELKGIAREWKEVVELKGV